MPSSVMQACSVGIHGRQSLQVVILSLNITVETEMFDGEVLQGLVLLASTVLVSVPCSLIARVCFCKNCLWLCCVGAKARKQYCFYLDMAQCNAHLPSVRVLSFQYRYSLSSTPKLLLWWLLQHPPFRLPWCFFTGEQAVLGSVEYDSLIYVVLCSTSTTLAKVIRPVSSRHLTLARRFFNFPLHQFSVLITGSLLHSDPVPFQLHAYYSSPSFRFMVPLPDISARCSSYMSCTMTRWCTLVSFYLSSVLYNFFQSAHEVRAKAVDVVSVSAYRFCTTGYSDFPHAMF